MSWAVLLAFLMRFTLDICWIRPKNRDGYLMNTTPDPTVRRAADVLLEEGAREVYVFGSHARGEARVDSDVDLAVSGLPPERFFRALSRASDAAGRPIDLIDLDEPTPMTRHLRHSAELRRVG
jgi:predicted nucleotidyltransferase